MFFFSSDLWLETRVFLKKIFFPCLLLKIHDFQTDLCKKVNFHPFPNVVSPASPRPRTKRKNFQHHLEPQKEIYPLLRISPSGNTFSR